MTLILLTNDDGIQSPGLHAAAKVLKGLGELLVVAPSTQQTAMGRSFTGRKCATFEPYPLELDGEPVRAFGLEASPASVVRHALQALCADRMPDLIVSGINYGENVGSCITCSGTVGAAYEGAGHGIPALAMALQMHPSLVLEHGEANWDTAAHFTRLFAERLLATPMPADVDVIKVDVPEGADVNTPWRLTRLSRQRYFFMDLEAPHAGSAIGDARFTTRVEHDTLESDSDVHALIQDKIVAVTPLSLDLTSRAPFGDIQSALEGR